MNERIWPDGTPEYVSVEHFMAINRLNSPEVTAMDVYRAMQYMVDGLVGPVELRADHIDERMMRFFKPEDLEHYKAAKEWWPTSKNLPEHLRFPSIQDLCKAWYVSDNTFLGRLFAIGNAANTWFLQDGATHGDRRAKTAARVKRYRERKAADPSNAAVREAYLAYNARCKQRKAVMAQEDAEVNALRLQWLALKNNPQA